MRQGKHHSTIVHTTQSTIATDEDISIQDEEFDQLQAKFDNAHRLYTTCLRVDTENQPVSGIPALKVASKNGLFDLETGLQGKIREIMLRKLQKNSCMSEMELYPVSVDDNLRKKLGIRASTQTFIKKMCKHFKKQTDLLREQQSFLAKKTGNFHVQYYAHDNYTQLKQVVDLYVTKISKKKDTYIEMCSRMSQGLLGGHSEMPKINMQQGSKLLFSHKQQQPPLHKPFKVLDYKLYLNNKVRKYKATRNLRKFREVVKSFPVGVMEKLYPCKAKYGDRRYGVHNDLYDTGRGSTERTSVPTPEKELSYKNVKDLGALKEKLVALCRSFGINDNINIDNGAFLLFRVDSFFKEKYIEQQKELDFPTDDSGKMLDTKLSLDPSPVKGGPKKTRIRFLKKATWLEDFVDYEECNAAKKMNDTIYENRFDSLSKSWLEFVQIVDYRESVTKIEFRVNRLRELMDERKNHQQEIFFEFYRAHTKLLVLKTRANIIKIHDSLNFFRSTERTLSLKKNEIHLPLTVEPTQNTTTTKSNQTLGNMSPVHMNKVIDNDREEIVNIEDGIFASPSKANTLKVAKVLQDDEIAFNENDIDVLNSDHKMIMYDVVLKDFEKVCSELLQVSGRYIDAYREKKFDKGNFSPVIDDVDRECLIDGLLEYEANYQYAKAKYLKPLVEVFHNTFVFKHTMAMIKHLQETIAKRPQFDLFYDSLQATYTQETEYYILIERLTGSLLEYQKTQENSLDEFQYQLFSQEENKELVQLYKEPFKPSFHSITQSDTKIIPSYDEVYKSDDEFQKSDTDFIVKSVENDFHTIKPYESLIGVFYAILETEQSIENALSDQGVENQGLAWVFETRKIMLEEAYDVWEQIRYGLALVSSLKEYETLHCDVLLDIPTSSYHVLNAINQIPTSPKTIFNLPTEKSKKDLLTSPGGAKSPVAGVASSNSIAAQKNVQLTEEEYLMRFIEFVKLKETLVVSLLSSGYQAQIYLHQIRLFGKDDINLDLLDKPGDFQRNFLNQILNLETLQLQFDLKELGDSKMIVLDYSKLEDLWVISEYILLQDILLQNTLLMNYYYTLDVFRNFSERKPVAMKAMCSAHSQEIFVNLMEKKNTWLIEAKINPSLITGKQAKGERPTLADRSRSKTDFIAEISKVIRQHVYYDALRIQAMVVAGQLRKLVVRLGLHDKQIFTVTNLYVEEGSAQLLDNSGVFSEGLEDSPGRRKSRYARMMEEYYDPSGRWKDPFVIPATQDIIFTEFDYHTHRTYHQETEHVKDKGTASLAQRIANVLEEETGTGKRNTKRKKSREVSTWIGKRPQLEFLKDSKIMSMLEWCHYLLKLVTYETFESTIEADTFDLVLFHEGGLKEQETFMRNELRLDQGLEPGIRRLKRVKDNVSSLIKGQKPGEPREFAIQSLRMGAKHKYYMILLASIQCAREARSQGDLETLKIFRSFLIKLAFNTLNYLYTANDRLVFHRHFSGLQQRKDTLMQEISLQDSEIMQLMDFVFTDSLLKHNDKSTLAFLGFMRGYKHAQKSILLDLFRLKRSWKANISSKMTNMRLEMEQVMMEKGVLLDDHFTKYIKETNQLLKRNIKVVMMQEAVLCLQERTRPFTTLSQQQIQRCNKNVQYHYTKALESYLRTKKPTSNLEKNDKTKEARESDSIEKFQFSPEILNILKNVLNIELEKMLLEEGTSHYMESLGKLWIMNRKGFKTLQEVSFDKTEKAKILNEMGQRRFLPFFYGFTSKILNKSLFIDAQNVGECIVIPIGDLEHYLYELNAGVTDYFEGMEFEMQRRYTGKIFSLESQLKEITKKFEKTKDQLEYVRKNQERVIDARLAEENSKMIFQIDMLKKKMKYIVGEHEFILKEAKEKVREEFKTKLIEDEISYKQALKRSYDYRKGMEMDIKSFINNEKNHVLKAIIEKKNQAFLTSQPDTAGKVTQEAAGNYPDDLFELNEGVEDGELVSKLYIMLKKTRALYQFKEALMREKCDEELNEMKKKLIANQNLLIKLNDLQNSEATLKDEFTDVKKELAMMDRKNKVLRKTLQKDSVEKIKLYREANNSKIESTEALGKYEDALKRKAIFINTNESTVKNMQQSKFYLKSHMSTINGLKSLHNSVDSFEGTDPIILAAQQKSSLGDEAIMGSLERSRIQTAQNSNSMKLMRPVTAVSRHSMMRSTMNLGETRLEEEKTKDRNMSDQNGRKMRSYVEMKTPVKDPVLFGISVKTGKRVRKSNEKGFIMKKFVPKGGLD